MGLCILMPHTFRVGDTHPVKINGKQERLTWRDEGTLVVEPEQTHKIVYIDRLEKGNHFICENDDGTRPMILDPGGRVVDEGSN